MRRRDKRVVMLLASVLALMVLCKIYPGSMVQTPTEIVAEN
jgi:hypothetical protein